MLPLFQDKTKAMGRKERKQQEAEAGETTLQEFALVAYISEDVFVLCGVSEVT